MTYLIPDEALTPGLFAERMAGTLPAHLGFELIRAGRETMEMAFTIAPHHMAPNGYLHGGTVVAFADTLAGFSTIANLREGQGFTTIELKTNFFSTLTEGRVLGASAPVHIGRRTQVWDVIITAEATARPLASFRCTNMVLA